ncbi:hypothetical protein HHL16_06935 [Pseudoflavitalea sp. G-6-1-2]|uniref:hypothetical protein n=1 Tax=Pseudoflavitalea sp. G-6-1-2 TaxID=2728841 RepID=UPI00146CFDEB|nr:hypothetical protein [Pseudoflavitalea sp. G-6-1-2]NML20601.1 hypothetical protein [Pseudoflavitalea sp. G-6-1-2]
MVAIISEGRKQWLKRGISAVLVLLFALSITPKKVLHDLLVDHQDDIAYHLKSAPLIIKSGFHCDTENQVAESPFTTTATVILPQPALITFITHNEKPVVGLHAVSAFHYSLRGPPATA